MTWVSCGIWMISVCRGKSRRGRRQPRCHWRTARVGAAVPVISRCWQGLPTQPLVMRSIEEQTRSPLVAEVSDVFPVGEIHLPCTPLQRVRPIQNYYQRAEVGGISGRSLRGGKDSTTNVSYVQCVCKSYHSLCCEWVGFAVLVPAPR